MTQFEYVSVMVSIVLALGVSHLLDEASRIVRERSWEELDPIFGIWFLIQVCIHLEVWWALWSYRDLQAWSYLSFVYVIVGPVLLVVNNGILVPPRRRNHLASLEKHFEAMRTRIMVIWVLFLLWSIGLGPVVAGRFVDQVESQLLFLGVVLLTLFTRNRMVHLVAGAAVLLVFAGVVISTRLLPG